MKTAATLIASICCLLIAATSATAQGDPRGPRPEGAQQPQHGQGNGETRILQHLLKMDDEALANLRQTVERIEKMPPEERAQLRERIGKINKMSPEKVDAMRKKYESIPQEQREAMRKRWMEMSTEERNDWREKLKDMSPEERKSVFEEQGFLAPPPKYDKRGPNSKRPGFKKNQSQRGPKPNRPLENEEN